MARQPAQTRPRGEVADDTVFSRALSTERAAGADTPLPRPLERGNRPPAGHRLFRGRNTRVADEDPRAGDQPGDLARRPATPRAGGVGTGVPRPPDPAPPAAARPADDLLDPLVADGERLRDLAKRRPGEVKPPDRGVIVGARQQGIALRSVQAGSGPARGVQQLRARRHRGLLECLVTIDNLGAPRCVVKDAGLPDEVGDQSRSEQLACRSGLPSEAQGRTAGGGRRPGTP